MPELNKSSVDIHPSEIRIMSVECEKVKGINLAQGVCDTDVPDVVRLAAEAAIDAGRNQYVRLDGIPELRRAIAAKLKACNHIEYDPDTEILVGSGSTGAFHAACCSVLSPGDEAIIFEPYYGYHVHTLANMGVKPVYVRMAPPDWTYSFDALERAITPMTRAIIMNTPANPSGKVFSRQEMEHIAALAIKHDLFVFTEEIYEYFLFDGCEHISIATLPGMRERTITISGFSKTFSITGWRIGYAACPARFTKAMGYFHDLTFICAPSPFQFGVTAGLEQLGKEFYSDLCAEYLQKRDLLCGALRDVGLTPYVPKGAYYVLVDASMLPGTNSKQRAMALLAKTGVAAVPGEAFYQNSGADQLRFCFAKKLPALEEACERLMKMRTTVGAH